MENEGQNRMGIMSLFAEGLLVFFLLTIAQLNFKPSVQNVYKLLKNFMILEHISYRVLFDDSARYELCYFQSFRALIFQK